MDGHQGDYMFGKPVIGKNATGIGFFQLREGEGAGREPNCSSTTYTVATGKMEMLSPE